MKYDDFQNYRHVLLRGVTDKFLELVEMLIHQTIKDMTVFQLFSPVPVHLWIYGD